MLQKSKIKNASLSIPGPNRSLQRRVPRPIICQNLEQLLTFLKNTRFKISGMSIPVSSMSTETAICGSLFFVLKSSISVSA